MAKANGTTPATLYLQNEGGLTRLGGDVEVAGRMDIGGDLSAGRSQLANTFIDTGVYLTTQDGVLVTTNITEREGIMSFLEFVTHSYAGGYPAHGIVQCYPYQSAIIQYKYTAMGNAPGYCRIFFDSSGRLCFWFPKIDNYTTYHFTLHTNVAGKTCTTTLSSLPSSREWEVTANVLLPWSPIKQGPGSALDADLLDGQHGSYYAKVNTATSSTATDLPVGSYITASGGYGMDLNASTDVYIGTSSMYSLVQTGELSKLSGTWRICGSTYVSGPVYLVRRVA
ncbi:MAG TPA: hypothetical protein DE117_05315 [Fervidobacterium sp.]|nr:hypothetical protein [Fervidobacterium sp.]